MFAVDLLWPTLLLRQRYVWDMTSALADGALLLQRDRRWPVQSIWLISTGKFVLRLTRIVYFSTNLQST